MGAADTTIATIDTWACSLPLDQPLEFGSFRVTKRDYTAVRVTTHGGLVADCLGLSRTLPVDVAISDVFAPLLLGTDATDVEARNRDRVERMRNVERAGVAAMAWSLLDICLWDLRAQALGSPLWQLLGGRPRPLPVLLVEGYALPGEDDARFGERLARRVAEGYPALKIEGASSPDSESLRRRLEAARAAVGADVGLIVDLAWKHETASDAATDINEWAHIAPLWVEDPFPREQPEEYARLRGLVSVPIGSGDEVSREADLTSLVDDRVLDVVRLDATTQGGITAALRTQASMVGSGLSLSAHTHPEVHRHCLLAWEGDAFIESFPSDRPFDLEHRLHEAPLSDGVVDGLAPVSDAPGTGIRLNLAEVERTAIRRSTR